MPKTYRDEPNEQITCGADCLAARIENDQTNYRNRLEEIHDALRGFFDAILGCEPTPECKEIGKPPLSAANFSAHYIDSDADIRSLLYNIEGQLSRRSKIIT